MYVFACHHQCDSYNKEFYVEFAFFPFNWAQVLEDFFAIFLEFQEEKGHTPESNVFKIYCKLVQLKLLIN